MKNETDDTGSTLWQIVKCLNIGQEVGFKRIGADLAVEVSAFKNKNHFKVLKFCCNMQLTKSTLGPDKIIALNIRQASAELKETMDHEE